MYGSLITNNKFRSKLSLKEKLDIIIFNSSKNPKFPTLKIHKVTNYIFDIKNVHNLNLKE